MMDDIVADMREKILGHETQDWEKYVPDWREQFRQRGLSVISLETLINFFVSYRSVAGQASTDAFVNPAILMESTDDEMVCNLRGKVDSLERQCRQVQSEARRYKGRFYAALSAVAILTIVLVAMLIFK